MSPTDPLWDELEIPEFLKAKGTRQERLARWKDIPVTDPNRGGYAEDWRERERVLKENLEKKRKEKNAKGLARLKEQHKNERYDRKLKRWITIVPVEKTDDK